MSSGGSRSGGTRSGGTRSGGTRSGSGDGRKSMDESYYVPPVNTTSNFFKQQRKMNFQQYIHTKKEEKTILQRNRAAILIQSAFRGWLVRTNLAVLNSSAIKIQALWRRAIARVRCKKLVQERKEKIHQDMLNKMATRIQALFRGYMSRKNRFNFKEYKKITQKNQGLKRSIERINELEEALSNEEMFMGGSDISLNASFNSGSSHSIKNLKNLSAVDALKSRIGEALKNRIGVDALKNLHGVDAAKNLHGVDAAKNLHGVDAAKDLHGADAAKNLHGVDALKNLSAVDALKNLSAVDALKNLSAVDALNATVLSIERLLESNSMEDLDNLTPSRLIELYSKLSMDAAATRRDSRRSRADSKNDAGPGQRGSMDDPQTMRRLSADFVDDMFQDFEDVPDEDGILKPDVEKTQLLKHAIRLLNEKICTREIEKFYKIHFMMRTIVMPGVYSDIYSNQLTEIEKKLKALKYWDISRLSANSKELKKNGQNSGLSLPMAQSAQKEEEQMLQKIYDFKINYFLPPPEPDEFPAPTVKLNPSTISLPAWKR